jgi:hypothetical protein
VSGARSRREHGPADEHAITAGPRGWRSPRSVCRAETQRQPGLSALGGRIRPAAVHMRVEEPRPGRRVRLFLARVSN